MRMPRHALLRVVAGVVMLTGGVAPALGGSAGATAATKNLTKDELIRTGDNVCRQADELLGDLDSSFFVDLPVDDVPDADTLDAFAAELEPIVQQEIDSIRALAPPPSDKKRITKLLDAAQRGLDKIADDPSLVLEAGPNPFAKADRLARRYGFEVCGAERDALAGRP